MYFHVSNGPVAAVGKGLLVDLKKRKQRQLAGNMKKAITTKIAGVASLILLQYKIHLKNIFIRAKQVILTH